MMREESSQPLYGTTGDSQKRYEPPQQYIPEEPLVGEADFYTAASVGQPLMQSEQFIPPGERKPNFPTCKPIVHHSIATDIVPEKRLFVKKAYLSWYFHCFCLFFNWICLLGGIILRDTSIGGFFLGVASLLLGIPVSFFVYFLLYRAMRTGSAFFFALWFGFFVGQLAAEVFYAIGLADYGAAGFMMMVTAFSNEQLIMGILGVLATFGWVGLFIFNLWLFYQARREFRNLGGSAAATKEFAKGSVQAAYDNRGAVKQVIVDNKDTIKQMATENKDVIINFAKDHKDEMVNFASENKETVARVAMENQDAIWENRDVVESVFDPRKA